MGREEEGGEHREVEGRGETSMKIHLPLSPSPFSPFLLPPSSPLLTSSSPPHFSRLLLFDKELFIFIIY